MLNALTLVLAEGDRVGEARAARSMERQGFVRATLAEWDGGRIVTWRYPGQNEADDSVVQTPWGLACCVGPLWFRGRFGQPALAMLLEQVRTNGRLAEDELRGNFALFLKTDEHTWLLNDALGFVRIYSSGNGRFFSTSWLAACAYLPDVELQASSAVEYVLLGASHSRQSVACGVDLLPLGEVHDLRCGSRWQRFPQGLSSQAPEFISLESAVDAITEHILATSTEVAAAFPTHVNMALSGGFDSRLIAAGLLSAGVKPHLFVYGSNGSADVEIAKKVAASICLPLDAIDKRAMNSNLPAPDIESMEQTALFSDGLPIDGIDDPGADRVTRLQQTADGRIALNGGGGEIFRNFFHLPGRRFSARDIVRAFYRGFNKGVFRNATDLSRYEERLAASMISVAGITPDAKGQLSRAEVELLYPLFRCHYWMGLNNSLGVRHGYYATPLVDFTSVRLALRVPLRWKNAGVLQSRLITALHPAIAAQPSAYGFCFDVGPGPKAMLAEWATCARPVRLRPLISATHRHLQTLRASTGARQHYRSLLPGEWRMDSLLDLARLTDDRAFGRALAVEVAWRRIFQRSGHVA